MGHRRGRIEARFADDEEQHAVRDFLFNDRRAEDLGRGSFGSAEDWGAEGVCKEGGREPGRQWKTGQERKMN
jgi:hypothetical protein